MEICKEGETDKYTETESFVLFRISVNNMTKSQLCSAHSSNSAIKFDAKGMSLCVTHLLHCPVYN